VEEKAGDHDKQYTDKEGLTRRQVNYDINPKIQKEKERKLRQKKKKGQYDAVHPGRQL